MKSSQAMDILIVGVGGQGTILASRILSEVALQTGKDVKVSEIHGMSQRGGSVVTQVRMGEQVHAPVIAKHTADIILGFEKLEALRWADYLADDGQLIVNDQQIDPMPVIMGNVSYPEGIVEELSSRKLTLVPALKLAQEAGSYKAVNVVLLGVLAHALGHEPKVWQEALEKVVPERFLEMNLKAFDLGFSYRKD